MKKLKWLFPLPRTHCGVALGNGDFGALIWGKTTLNITLGKVDFWDRRGGGWMYEKAPNYKQMLAMYSPTDRKKNEAVFQCPEKAGIRASQRLPAGRFEIEFNDNILPRRAVLDCLKGTLSIEMNSDKGQAVSGLVITLSPLSNVLYIEDAAGLIKRIIPRPAWEWVGQKMSELGFKPPQPIQEKALLGWIQNCPQDPSLASICKKTENGAAICLALGADGQTALANACSTLEAFEKEGITSFYAKTLKWWRAYWKRVPKLQIPSEFFQRFVLYAQYKFACATNPGSSHPAPLQGPWTEEYQMPPWLGSYVFDVNVQQIYTFGFLNNCLDHLMPLFNMLESDSFQKIMRHDAKVLYNIDDGLVLQQWVDDRGYFCWPSPPIQSASDQALAGWTAQLYWLYYVYSHDKEFLKQRAYPFMAGVMRCYEEMLEEKDGKLAIPLSCSPEYNWPLYDKEIMGRNPTYQLGCIHMLANALLEASKILGLPPRPIWVEIKQKLPQYSAAGEGNDKRMAIWEGQDLEMSHRHHSHLAGLYPFDIFDLSDENTRQTIENTIDHWIAKGFGQWSEWCIPWAAIIQARMGFNEAPMVLMNMWQELFVNEGLATVYLPRFRGISAHRRADMIKPKETNEIMQLDGTMGAATAIYELLVHTRHGVTRVFPAIPEKWHTVSFKNIRVPGPFLISASKKNGVVQQVKIKSLANACIKIAVPSIPRMTLARRSCKEESIQLPADITLKRGETVMLKNNAG